MLVFWTAAKSADISATIGKTLEMMKPVVPDHRFESFVDGQVLRPAPGEIVVVCGTRPLVVLQKAGLAPKNRTVNSLREKALPLSDGGSYMVTFDPGLRLNDPGKGLLLQWDVRLAARLLITGSLEPVLGEYKWVGSFAPMIERIKAKFEKTGKPVPLAADAETMGLYPWYDGKDFVSLGFTDEAGKAECLYLGPFEDPVAIDPKVREQVEWLFTSPMIRLRGANFKFDLVWVLEKLGIDCTNFKADTCLIGSILDENRSNGLNVHTKIMTDLGGYDDKFNAENDKGHMEAIPPDKLLPYQGGDIDATFRVSEKLLSDLAEDPALMRFYVKILHPAARAFEKIERRGMLVDEEAYRKVGEELEIERLSRQEAALALLPPRLKVKHREKIEGQLKQGKSPFTPKIIEEYFFGPLGLNLKPKMKTEKSNKPSTSKTHLQMFSTHEAASDMCGLLEEMNSAAKTKSTFVDGFLKHLRPDGRLHPTYMLYHGAYLDRDDDKDDSGTVTGRLAAKEPAVQTLVKHSKWAKPIRAAYPAPKGKVVCSLDFVQGELKIGACVAEEKNMLKAYEAGMDLHAVTGAQLGGVKYEEFISWADSQDAKLSKLFSDLRQRAKAGNFGLLFGMGAAGFQKYAWAKYKLILTLEEAEDIRNAFFASYPGLLDYHAAQKKAAHMFKGVRSPLGRVRHLPMVDAWDQSVSSKAERQAINSPIQSCLSDMMIWAIALIEDAYPGGEIETVAMIHDAVIAYVPEVDTELWVGRMAEVMENLPFKEIGWQPQLKFTVDAEVGPNLAQLQKLKLAA